VRLAVEGQPAMPLWPSGWSSLAPPELPAAAVARVERLDGAARTILDPAATLAAALAIERLTGRDFLPAHRVNWAGARLYRVTMADGAAIDLQLVADGDAGWRVRMTSDDRADVRLVRAYAFLLPRALP
jgi:hypothetical protein